MNLQIDAIRFARRNRTILDGLTFTLVPGEVLAIVGPNGAGKSTLLQIMAGDLAPTSGEVRLDGRPLGRWQPAELARRRAVMPQAARLGFSLPAHDVVALGRLPFETMHGKLHNARAVAKALDAANVTALAARDYASLSGGEQQRVQLARAIAQLDLPQDDTHTAAAPILLLDEPTASLDLAQAHGALLVARNLARPNGNAQGVAVAAVLHDLGLAYRYADRVLVLAEGRALALASPAEALTPAILAQAFGIEAALIEGHLVVKGPLAA